MPAQDTQTRHGQCQVWPMATAPPPPGRRAAHPRLPRLHGVSPSLIGMAGVIHAAFDLALGP